MTTESIAPKTQYIDGSRELHQVYLHINDARISSLCAKCAALGKVLINEVGNNPDLDRKKVTALVKQVDEIGVKINKNLLDEVSKVHNLMHHEFDKEHELRRSGNSHPTGSPYEKSLNRLVENRQKTDLELEDVITRFYEQASRATASNFKKLTEALSIYENTLCDIRVVQIECSDLLTLMIQSKSTLKTLGDQNEAQPNNEILSELSTSLDTLILKCKTLLETFNMQEVNGITMMKLADSAQQKHIALMRQLKNGDISHADVLLAVAQQHQTDSIVGYGLKELKPIKQEFEILSKQLLNEHKKIRQKTQDALARELLKPKSSEDVQIETLPRKAVRKENTVPERSLRTLNTKKQAKSITGQVPKPLSTTVLQNELAKVADWLRHDTNILKTSTSSDKKQLGNIISEQLNKVYNEIELYDQVVSKTKPEEFKKNIEQQLSNLEGLIADALATKSQKNSPIPNPVPRPISPSVNNRAAPDQKLPPATETSKQAVPSIVSTTAENSATRESISTLTQASSIESTNSTDSLNEQIELAIQKLNFIRTKIFQAGSRQESFKQSILTNRQAHDVTWINIHHTDTMLHRLSESILSHPHSLYIKPYVEYNLPMAEMILTIQTERIDPHFDPINCQRYLEEAMVWLGSLTPEFEYLEHLMAFTEAMIYPPHRFA